MIRMNSIDSVHRQVYAAVTRNDAIELAQLLGSNPKLASLFTEEGSLLHTAVKRQCIDSARVILEQSPEIAVIGARGGMTALHVAAESGQQDMVLLLLQHNQELASIGDRGNRKADWFARRHGHYAIERMIQQAAISSSRVR